MKKIILMSLILITIITGCFKSDEEKIDEVLTNMKALESYHMAIDYEVNYLFEGKDVNIKTSVESDIDKKANLMVNLSKYNNDDTQKMETSYVKLNEDLVYLKHDDWYFSNEKINVPFEKFDFTNIVKENGKYKVTLTYDDVNNIMMLCKGIENYKIRYDEVEAFLTFSNGYIEEVSIVIPMDTLIGEVATSVNVSTLIEFSKFNEISSIIPSDVANNARNIKVYEIKTVVEKYLSELDVNQLNEENYSLSNLNYENVMFDKIELKKMESISGFIEVDGYKASISENKIVEIIKLDF